MLTAVYRKEHFNAAHRLHNPLWSDEKNIEIFGLCNNPHYHGHNYEVIIKVIGEINPETGYVVDMKILKHIIQQEVTLAFDHKNLNIEVEEFKNLNPTAENIAMVIYNRIIKHLDKNLSLQIRLYETERNFVEYPANL